MKIELLEPNEFLENYSVLAPIIQKAIDRSGTTTHDMVYFTQEILSNRCQCWIILDEEDVIHNVTLTSIIEFEGAQVLHLIATSGSEFERCHAAIEVFGKEMGCVRVMFWGRKGWTRKLKNLSSSISGNQYKENYVVMSMDL